MSTASLQSLLKGFTLHEDTLISIKTCFKRALQQGLTSEGQAVKALPTFITELPNGQEIGDYLVVDLGGSNLRVGCVQLEGSHKFSLDIHKWSLTETIKDSNNQVLFDFIAYKVGEYLKMTENSVMKQIYSESCQVTLGFTFSYPVKQLNISHGELIQWNKAIKCQDAIGKDVVELLEEALARIGLGHIKVGVLLNDTVATLAAHTYVDPDTKLGVILGTGTNAAYVEQTSRIGKLGIKREGIMLVNTEWGAFGDDCPSLLPRTPMDEDVDAQSPNPGKQIFEKMISGMYLGEIARLALQKALPCSALDKLLTFDTQHLSEVASQNFGSLDNLFSEGDQAVVECLCAAVVKRAAALCSASIGAVYELIGAPKARTVVAFDGSLYEHYPRISELIKSNLDKLCPGNSLVLQLAKNESIVGAAAALAAQPGQLRK